MILYMDLSHYQPKHPPEKSPNITKKPPNKSQKNITPGGGLRAERLPGSHATLVAGGAQGLWEVVQGEFYGIYVRFHMGFMMFHGIFMRF